MQKFISQLTAFIKDEEGASAIEYALIALAISVGAKALGGQLNTTFATIVTKLAAALQ